MSAYNDDLMSLECPDCGAAYGDRCRYPNGAIREHLPCLGRLKARDRLQDAADRLREAGYESRRSAAW